MMSAEFCGLTGGLMRSFARSDVLGLSKISYSLGSWFQSGLQHSWKF